MIMNQLGVGSKSSPSVEFFNYNNQIFKKTPKRYLERAGKYNISIILY